MGGWFSALGQQAASQAVTGGIAMGFQRIGSKYDRRMNEKLQRQQMGIQMQGEREMMNYQQQKQLEMWEKTGYGAQVEQMKKAGINPALMYGMGGGGGQTVGAGGSPAVQGSAQYVETAPKGMGIESVAQLALLNAQRKNIEADTALKTAGVPKVGAETENLQANTTLTRIKTELEKVAASVSRQTIGDQMQAIVNAAQKGTQEIQNLKQDEQKTKEQINQIKAETASIAIKNALMQAQKENINQDTKNKIQEVLESEQRIKSMAGQLMIAWDKLNIDTQKWSKEWMEFTQGDTDWQFIKDLVPGFLIPIGKGFGGKSHTPIKGFQK